MKCNDINDINILRSYNNLISEKTSKTFWTYNSGIENELNNMQVAPMFNAIFKCLLPYKWWHSKKFSFKVKPLLPVEEKIAL